MLFDHLHNLAGTIGVLAILYGYYGLQSEKLKFDDYLYLLLNAVGSFLIVLSLLIEFNLSAFFMELAWVFVSLYGLYKRWIKSEKK
ncbi:MAG: hypothetical protein ACKOW3_07780 [Hyphomicrobium sp.]